MLWKFCIRRTPWRGGLNRCLPSVCEGIVSSLRSGSRFESGVERACHACFSILPPIHLIALDISTACAVCRESGQTFKPKISQHPAIWCSSLNWPLLICFGGMMFTSKLWQGMPNIKGSHFVIRIKLTVTEWMLASAQSWGLILLWNFDRHIQRGTHSLDMPNVLLHWGYHALSLLSARNQGKNSGREELETGWRTKQDQFQAVFAVNGFDCLERGWTSLAAQMAVPGPAPKSSTLFGLKSGSRFSSSAKILLATA